MPDLQNDVIETLGCPDIHKFPIKTGPSGILYASPELAVYVDSVYGESGEKNPLVLYCLRSLLSWFALYKSSMVRGEPKGNSERLSRELIERFTGKGMGCHLATAFMMALVNSKEILPASEWKAEDHFVEDTV